MDQIDWEWSGIPLHPLIVHGAVVLIPLAAIMLLLSALWPAAARKLTFLTPVVATGAFLFAFLAHLSGEWLQGQLPTTDAIETHVTNADLMNPIALGLVVVSWLFWTWQRSWRNRLSAPTRRTVRNVVDVAASTLVIALSTFSLYWVFVVGHSGAEAVWGG